MKQQWTLQLEDTLRQLNTNHQKNTRIAIVRFVLFLIMAWSFFNLVDGHQMWWLAMIPAFILFMTAMDKHQKIRKQSAYLKARIRVLQRLVDSLDEQWKKRECDLSGLPDDPVWQDLDLFSAQSLFQFLDMTSLPQGRETLVQYLTSLSSVEELRERQETVRCLLNHPDFMIEDWTYAHQLTDKERKALASENLEQVICPIPLPVSEKIIHSMPVILILLLGLSLMHLIHPALFIGFFFIQCALALFSMGTLQSGIQSLSNLRQGLQCSMDRLQALDQAQLSSPLLNRLNHLIRDQDGIYANIARIDRILDLFSVRANPFLSLPLQLLLLWDMQWAVQWNHIQKKTGSRWITLMSLLGELEALESLSMIGLTHHNTCFPVFCENEVLEFTDLVHPLIHEQKAVGNSGALDHSITLITGSNMSGKTTFMRTVGLNQILAQAGGCVCGSNMTTSLYTILTSMKITDNVNEGISTFYQELLRIRKIIEALREEKPLLILIDEVFKGTNSLDRIDGSKRIVRQLNHSFVRAMITTHDFELCDMEQEDLSLVNIHFEEQYQDQKICFDYKMKPGRCTQRNARYLMKMIGLDD